MGRQAVSASYSLESFGKPYFAAVQSDLSFMDSPNAPQMNTNPAGGLLPIGWYIDVAVKSLPVQNASADEVHVLASYHETGPTGVDIMYIGITPSGRLVGYNRALGVAVSTGKGFIVADGAFNRFGYQTAVGGPGSLCRWSVDSNGVISSPSIIAYDGGDHGSVDMSPAAGMIGEVMLFNGRSGLTRCDCEIRFARLQSNFQYDEWLFAEGTGFALADTTTDLTASVHKYNGALALTQVIPFLYGKTLAWGPIPDLDLSASCQWRLRTEWTKATPVSTAWTKQAA